MKVVALISGGKDSCFNMMHCVANGHQVVALANLRPPESAGTDELDSFMFQTVGHDVISCYAECMGVPLFRQDLARGSVDTSATYTPNAADEVEDLFVLLRAVKEAIPDVDAVSTGAILSNYQRARIEHVCARLGLQSLAFLWQGKQETLLGQMISHGVEAVLVKVAAVGLGEVHLGKTLAQMQAHLMRLNERYGINVCGEGGEYETLTLDCPIFRKRIRMQVIESETRMHSYDDMAPVAFLKITKLAVEDKSGWEETMAAWTARMREEIGENPCGIDQDVARAMAQAFIRDAAAAKLRVDQKADETDGGPAETSPPNVYWRAPLFAISAVTASGVSAAKGEPHADATLESETRAVAEYIVSALAECGLSPRHITQMHVHVADMAQFGALNKTYQEFFGHVNPPTRVTVQTALPDGCKVQMDCFAARDDAELARRDTLHVQGISYWAPANIGPYSQAVVLGDHVYLAGQIGLVPHTMKMPDAASDGGLVPSMHEADPRIAQITREASVSLRSLSAVPESLRASLAEACIVGVCYVPSADLFGAARAAWAARFEDSGLVPPTTFVAVQRLPRDALVEWEALVGHAGEAHRILQAHADSGDGATRVITTSGDVQADVARITGGDGADGRPAAEARMHAFGSFVGVVAHAGRATAPPVRVGDAVAQAVRSVDAVLARWEAGACGSPQTPWDLVFAVRVFHLACAPGIWVRAQVLAALRGACGGGEAARLPAVTAIAVDAIGDDSLVSIVAYGSNLEAFRV
ncbi:hypothetical protein HK105_205841 [Polyrhizophydium stewartii]|uniref:Diphthine--ammonia ligase n=1 Tax=Polyrhizophydium stewartii TaxID=2732419 RepID=A0ABR4N5E6_9FUNG|nr:ATP binding domain 4 [Polyrhizophydium stewartii]